MAGYLAEKSWFTKVIAVSAVLLPHAECLKQNLILTSHRQRSVDLHNMSTEDMNNVTEKLARAHRLDVHLLERAGSNTGAQMDASEPIHWDGVILAAIAGFSTMLGGLIVFAFPDGLSQTIMALGLSLAAGAMIAVSGFLLVPRASTAWWHYLMFVLGAALTYLLMLVASRVDGSIKGANVDAPASQKPSDGEPGNQEGASLAAQRLLEPGANVTRLAWLLALSLTLHNFPEGMAVGISSFSTDRMGAVIAVGIGIHNIPEGVVIALAVYGATQSQKLATLMTFLSSIPEPLGALFAVVLLRDVSEDSVRPLQFLVAGVMVFISATELIPQSFVSGCKTHAAVGFAAGVAIMLGTEFVLEMHTE